jgi:hypothetical protein
MRGLLFAAVALVCLLAPSAASAARYEVRDFTWSSRLTFKEVDGSAEPTEIRNEQGETVTRFDYDDRRGSSEFVSSNRSSGFTVRRRYDVNRAATWRQLEGASFEDRDCIDVDRRRRRSGVRFERQSTDVLVKYRLPVAVDNCGPMNYDDEALADAVRRGSRQRVPFDRFGSPRLTLGIKGTQPINRDTGLRGRLNWRASLVLVRTR